MRNASEQGREHAERVEIGPGPLTEDDVVAVARYDARADFTSEALAAISAGRAAVEKLAHSDQPAYGVSTGFGALATRHIPAEQRTQLQRNIIRSHTAGSGAPVEREVVRAMMAVRAATFATGHTGVRSETARAWLDLLNRDVTPVVPEHGSLGCSGDLAPLSHAALTLIGEGRASRTLDEAGLAPVTLAEKEGLALINGTDGMLGMLVLACHDLDRLLRTADLTAAMSVEALLGTDRAFADDLQAMRPHPGQRESATRMRELLADSEIMASHRTPDCNRVQDAYSLRCSPQVNGACRDTLAHARRVAERELASAIDNPVVTADGRVESNGNFHGAPLAYVSDFLAIAIADLASIAERRTDRFLDVSRNQGLPAFLADDPGVDSGYMIAQYTQAGVVAELKRLATPASADSIPSSAMQEDHVSMGWGAARKLRRAVDGLHQVLAIELITAARGLELRAPLRPAPRTAAVVRTLRDAGVAGPGPDRVVTDEIETAVALIRSGRLPYPVGPQG